jgi:hypothetical protein
MNRSMAARLLSEEARFRETLGRRAVGNFRHAPAPSGALWPLTRLHYAGWLCEALAASTGIDRMEG